MYIWQHPNWPSFIYNISDIESILYQYALETGVLTGSFSQISQEIKDDTMIDLMVSEAIKTSEIEGEKIAYDDVRSSIRNQLGLDAENVHYQDPRAVGIARLLVAVRNTFHMPLSKEMLFEWHGMVISDAYHSQRIGGAGKWRTTQADPMQIVSGPIGKEIVHYEAPPSDTLEREMDGFIQWFNDTNPTNGIIKIAGPVRAAIAHLYFECIHPFADGNGRIGRALCEKVLSQELGGASLISLSNAIYKNKKQYYLELSFASREEIDISPWVSYFVRTILQAQVEAKEIISFVLSKSQFWKMYAGMLNERQEKAIKRMFKEDETGFEGGINPQKYMKITACSKATATRDLSELLNIGCLLQLPGGGRSTSYQLNLTIVKI